MNEILRYFVWQKMNYCFVLLLTFQLALSYENPSKIDKLKWKNITKFSCKRINCPPVEEPTCVRMRHKKIGSNTKDIYIMLLNKCEMEYMKCHQDYQATEVSMKNCGHYEKSLKSSDITGKIRAKRETLRGLKEPANQAAKKQIDKQVNMTLKQNPPKSILGEISIFGSPFDLGQHMQQNKGRAVRSTSKPSAADAKNKDEDSTERNEDDEISNEASEREDSENTVDVNEDAELITLEKNSEESDTEETTLSPLLDDTTKKENGDELSIKESEEVSNKDSSETNKQSEDSSSSSKSDHYEVQLESNDEESQNTQADSKDESGINVKTEEDENIDEDTTEDPKINEKTEGDSTEDSKISEKTQEDNKEDPKISEKSEGDNEEDTKTSEKTEDKEDSKVNVNSEESSESHSEHVSEDSIEMEDTKPTKTTETPKQSANYKNTNDYDLMEANEGVNFEEYDKECPTECPAAEVMLCGRCKDGVYRTFMSICHLRMFNCKHPDEKVELVTRYPCILSAPYLNEAPSPRGRVSQPGDKDLVLQYIRCREKSLGKNDDQECSLGTKI